MNDPYQILGVTKTANLDDIKKAYKKLARQHHPDLNPGKKESEEKFKAVANAFALIGTAEARALYDSGETAHTNGAGRSRGPTYQETQDRSGRYAYEYAAGMDEDFFASFFARNKGQQTGSGFNNPGVDELYQMEIDFKESAVGAEKFLTLPNGKKLQVQIPGGITSGKKLKFRGQGKPGSGTGLQGDLYVEILVRPSLQFERLGNDIVSEVLISLFEAMNGGAVEVETVDGKVMLTVPAGVTSGTKLRIKGKGAGKKDDRGNHLALIKVVMPRDPSPEFRDSMAQLGKQFHYDPRSHS